MSALLERAGLEYRGNYLEVDGRRIHYLDYGNGPPLLLLHGGGAGSAIWFRQIEVLARTRRVIAPDHPVFGLSSQEPYQSPLTGSLLRYLTGFMDALGLDRVDAVGLSMGAQAALATALAGTGRLDRLVVIDGAGRCCWPGRHPPGSRAIAPPGRAPRPPRGPRSSSWTTASKTPRSPRTSRWS